MKENKQEKRFDKIAVKSKRASLNKKITKSTSNIEKAIVVWKNGKRLQ